MAGPRTSGKLVRVARRARDVLLGAARAWSADGATSWAAAVAFYTMLSLGPLLFVGVAVSGLVFGRDAALQAILQQVQDLLGSAVGDTLRGMVAQAAVRERGLWTTLLGLATLVFGASGVFSALQEAMDAIWHVEPDPEAGLGALLRRRFLSLAMVGCVGFLLATSLLLSAAVAMVQRQLTGVLALSSGLAWAAHAALSLALDTAFFAAVYKVLPDARISWRHTWLGGAATALLFELGRALISVYICHAQVHSPYGAAGSLALLLIWTYYAAQVFFFGAELTRVSMQASGRSIEPAVNAIRVEKRRV